jgi:hypothetical protein
MIGIGTKVMRLDAARTRIGSYHRGLVSQPDDNGDRDDRRDAQATTRHG